jgi:hypothetical protein
MSLQMLRAGLPPDSVVRALSDFAMKCPVVVGLAETRKDAISASALPGLIAEYSSEVVEELDRQSVRLAARARQTASIESSR